MVYMSYTQLRIYKSGGWWVVTQCIYLELVVERDEYHLYNETTKCMTSSHDVVFCENIFKISNEHTTIATSSYVRLDTVFMDNSTSTQLNDIEDNLTNWTSSDEWKFTVTSTRAAVSEKEGKS
jgi:hypothetical protein